MDSWRSVFLANGTLLPSDSFSENRNAMLGFQHQLEDDHLLISDLPANSNGFTSLSTTKLEGHNQSSSSNLSRIDFKLRTFLDYGNHDTSSAAPSKKPRPCSEKPLCQVYGCNMDLSFSKDYHKRHRVCETHSKTSAVIVSGIQQRFCQQCSRFHYLSEFDDGKRSCRRRLAGHNERRRKPSFYFLQGKRHKLLHTSQESFPDSFLYRVMDEHDHRASRLVSFKDEPTHSLFPAIGQNSSRTYKSKPPTYSIWDLHEAAPHSVCALSLLSAQSQQHLSEIPNTTFSITQPNQNLNNSTKGYQQMQPLWMDPSNSSSGNGKRSSTVDLLQLSSHLERIEQQRNTTEEVKQEYRELYFPAGSSEKVATFNHGSN